MADKTLSDRLQRRLGVILRKTGQRLPRATLIRALDPSIGKSAQTTRWRQISDAGPTDTIEIPRRGWQVHAVDASRDAIDGLLARSDLPENAHIDTQLARYEDGVAATM